MEQLKIYLSMLLLCIIGNSNAQTLLADTLNIQVDENTTILVATENGYRLDSTLQIDRIYRALETEIPGIIAQTNLDLDRARIAYHGQGNAAEISWTIHPKRYGLHIDSTGAVTRHVLNKDSIIIVPYGGLSVALIFEDISDRTALDKVNIDETIWNVRQKLIGDINKHVPFKTTYKVSENKSVERISFERSPGDQIEISASIGLGLIRHDFTPRINAHVSFDFMNKRQQLHNQIKLTSSFNYSFVQKTEGTGSRMYVNTFLGLEYAHNFSRKEGSLYGIGIHYLVGQNGPIFEGDTWKVNFAYYNPKWRLHIQPEVYITKNFKEAFPGMSVMFGF